MAGDQLCLELTESMITDDVEPAFEILSGSKGSACCWRSTIRHRVLVTDPPPPTAGRHRQGRSIVRRRPSTGRRSQCDRHRDRPDGARVGLKTSAEESRPLEQLAELRANRTATGDKASCSARRSRSTSSRLAGPSAGLVSSRVLMSAAARRAAVRAAGALRWGCGSALRRRRCRRRSRRAPAVGRRPRPSRRGSSRASRVRPSGARQCGGAAVPVCALVELRGPEPRCPYRSIRSLQVAISAACASVAAPRRRRCWLGARRRGLAASRAAAVEPCRDRTAMTPGEWPARSSVASRRARPRSPSANAATAPRGLGGRRLRRPGRRSRRRRRASRDPTWTQREAIVTRSGGTSSASTRKNVPSGGSSIVFSSLAAGRRSDEMELVEQRTFRLPSIGLRLARRTISSAWGTRDRCALALHDDQVGVLLAERPVRVARAPSAGPVPSAQETCGERPGQRALPEPCGPTNRYACTGAASGGPQEGNRLVLPDDAGERVGRRTAGVPIEQATSPCRRVASDSCRSLPSRWSITAGDRVGRPRRSGPSRRSRPPLRLGLGQRQIAGPNPVVEVGPGRLDAIGVAGSIRVAATSGATSSRMTRSGSSPPVANADSRHTSSRSRPRPWPW